MARRKIIRTKRFGYPLLRDVPGPTRLGAPPPFSTTSRARERNLSPPGPSTNFRCAFPVSLSLRFVRYFSYGGNASASIAVRSSRKRPAIARPLFSSLKSSYDRRKPTVPGRVISSGSRLCRFPDRFPRLFIRRLIFSKPSRSSPPLESVSARCRSVFVPFQSRGVQVRVVHANVFANAKCAAKEETANETERVRER